MNRLLSLTFLIFISLTVKSQIRKINTDHFNVKYEAETEEYVDASLKVLELVWKIATNNGYKLPDKLKFSVIQTDRNVLYFDRKKLNGIILEYKTLDTFLSPKEGGKNNIYGLCHEIGHLCMHNTISNKNNWMSYNYRESWADFFGNCLIDSVHQKLGNDFWPVSYDYLEYSGIKYMKKRIEKGSPKLIEFNNSCLFWIELNSKIGFGNMHNFFAVIKNQRISNPNAKQKFFEALTMYVQETDIKEWFDKYEDNLIIDKN